MIDPHRQHAPDPPLPELQRTILDDATLDALVRDLRACATVQSIDARPDVMTFKPDDVFEAVHQLRIGAIKALQIRYAFKAESWSDTLIRISDGIQLVRARMSHISSDSP